LASMRFRALAVAVSTALLTLLPAAAAIAGEGGEGTYGKASDKVITNFGFGLMIFFVLLVTTLSLVQYLLERRKGK
jgi:putative copper export protein